MPLFNCPVVLKGVLQGQVRSVCLALDLVAVLASLEGLVVVGVPGGHEGLNESAKKDNCLFENVHTIPRN